MHLQDSIAIESALGGRYMRKREYEIRMETNDGSASFLSDASWMPLDGRFLRLHAYIVTVQ